MFRGEAVFKRSLGNPGGNVSKEANATAKGASKNVLTKEDLIREISRVCDLTLTDSQQVLDAMIGGKVRALARGERIEVRGFGIFFSRDRKARTGRNPKTGEKVDVPQKRVGRFKPAKELLRLINGETESK